MKSHDFNLEFTVKRSFKYLQYDENRKEYIKALQKFKGGSDYVQFGWDGAGVPKSFMKMGFEG